MISPEQKLLDERYFEAKRQQRVALLAQLTATIYAGVEGFTINESIASAEDILNRAESRVP